MDNVIILKRHEVTILLKPKNIGHWENGEYISENSIEKMIKGVFLPVSSEVLKNYPQGSITLKDMELFTKEVLKEGDILVLREEEWKIIEITDFNYIADIKSYILRRSTKDD